MERQSRGYIKLTMEYMETTHGYYDAIPALFNKNKSILPMNVRSNYWKDIGFT